MNSRVINNEQLDRLYEIRDYLLSTAMELNNIGYGTNDKDSEINIVLNHCDALLDELDPSSDFNTGHRE